MSIYAELGKDFKEILKLKYHSVGFFYSRSRPANAVVFKKQGGGCVMPLIFTAAKGKTVAYDNDSLGWPCSAFYLGYREWIFPGIENFLSHIPVSGRTCERFIKTPELAREFISEQKVPVLRTDTAVFKPLEQFDDSEEPKLVIFFANPDQLSALVFLLHYDAPCAEDRVISRFASACGSVVTFPLKYIREGRPAAVWGSHDISQRPKLPADITTLTIPCKMLLSVYPYLDECFLSTEKWEKLAKRQYTKQIH